MQHDKYTEVEILNRENLFETEIRLTYENVVQLNFCFIIGDTPLTNLKKCNMVKGFSCDYMHCVCLG